MKTTSALAILGLLIFSCSSDNDEPAPPPPPALALTSFSPTSGTSGTAVTLTGTGFSTTLANNAVKFNGLAAIVTAATATSLTATAPAGGTTGKISVEVNSKV